MTLKELKHKVVEEEVAFQVIDGLMDFAYSKYDDNTIFLLNEIKKASTVKEVDITETDKYEGFEDILMWATSEDRIYLLDTGVMILTA